METLDHKRIKPNSVSPPTRMDRCETCDGMGTIIAPRCDQCDAETPREFLTAVGVRHFCPECTIILACDYLRNEVKRHRASPNLVAMAKSILAVK